MLGVERILSASAVGSLQGGIQAARHRRARPVLRSHARGAISTFFGRGLVAHVGFAHPFCGDLSSDRRRRRREAVGATVHRGGTYVNMEGPQFSTLAESKLYRSWGMDVIGMTNLQEAKLAREAEICYATLALVTDYDCWHPDHDSVTVDMIIANLMQNAATAQQVIAERRRAPADRAHVRVRGRARDRDHHAAGRDSRAGRSASWRRSSASTSSSSTLPYASNPHLDPTHEHRRHRFDRLRLPDVVSREVHRALPAGAHDARQPELPRRHDGQAARRLRAEHRLHAGAARRAAAADGDGRRGLRRLPALARGGRRRHVARASRSPASSRASFFCSTDSTNNQIASFYTGAMANAGELSFRDVPDCGLAIISPNDPGAMVQYAEECRTLGIPLHLRSRASSARGCRATSCATGIVGATIVICNDYEFELIRQKTGLGEDDILAHARGADRHARRARLARSSTRRRPRSTSPRCTPHRIVDPTGVGDAFRGGLLKGMARGAATRCARRSAAWRRPTRSSTSAARATPTRGRSSSSATKRISATPPACSSEPYDRARLRRAGDYVRSAAILAVAATDRRAMRALARGMALARRSSSRKS